jgi:hypothetical protein
MGPRLRERKLGDLALPTLGHPGGDLDSGREAQFGENVFDMAFGGPLGDDHCRGYLPVTQPIRYEVGDLEFPGQDLEALRDSDPVRKPGTQCEAFPRQCCCLADVTLLPGQDPLGSGLLQYSPCAWQIATISRRPALAARISPAAERPPQVFSMHPYRPNWRCPPSQAPCGTEVPRYRP